MVIAGVKKAGTGALRTFLGYHSMVKCAPREVHFFDDELKFERGYDWYLRQMPLAKSGQVVVEKTPKYFITPRAVKELSKVIIFVNLRSFLRCCCVCYCCYDPEKIL